MARSAAQGRSSSRRSKQLKNITAESSTANLKQTLGGYNYKNLARKIRANPLLLNVGIGVGTFYLVKYAIRYYKNHPEIMEFIKENLDTVETKFKEYRTSFSGEEDMTEARH